MIRKRTQITPTGCGAAVIRVCHCGPLRCPFAYFSLCMQSGSARRSKRSYRQSQLQHSLAQQHPHGHHRCGHLSCDCHLCSSFLPLGRRCYLQRNRLQFLHACHRRCHNSHPVCHQGCRPPCRPPCLRRVLPAHRFHPATHLPPRHGSQAAGNALAFPSLVEVTSMAALREAAPTEQPWERRSTLQRPGRRYRAAWCTICTVPRPTRVSFISRTSTWRIWLGCSRALHATSCTHCRPALQHPLPSRHIPRLTPLFSLHVPAQLATGSPASDLLPRDVTHVRLTRARALDGRDGAQVPSL